MMPDDNYVPTTSRSRTRRKTVTMVAAVLLVEAVLIAGVMWKFLGSHPRQASAVDLQRSAPSQDDKIVEALVLDAKMPNNKSGVTYIYAAEVFVQVKKRHLERVKAEIEQFQNEIKADITAIWRTAEPQHFQEPKLENLTRKVYALLNDRFGIDKQRNERIISKVVIVMSTGYRVDN